MRGLRLFFSHDVYQHVVRQLQDDAIERLAALVDGNQGGN
jgi:hypothetical protein